MKITKSQLRKIIKEELETVTEAEDTGHLLAMIHGYNDAVAGNAKRNTSDYNAVARASYMQGYKLGKKKIKEKKK